MNSAGDLIHLGGNVEVDYRQLEQKARRLILDEPNEGVELKTEDLIAELLPGWSEDWVIVERERFRQLRLHALEAMCEKCARLGRFSEAIDAGLAVVQAEPLRESAHRVLISAYLTEGNRHEAMRQYAECRRLLLRDLGIEPAFTIASLMGGLPG